MKLNYLVATIVDGWHVTTNGIVATAKPARKQKGRGPERMKKRLAKLWVKIHDESIPQDDRLVVIQAEELKRVAELAEELAEEMKNVCAMLGNGKALVVGYENDRNYRIFEVGCSSQGGVDVFIDADSLQTVGKKGKGTLTIREMAIAGAGLIRVEGERYKALAIEVQIHPHSELMKAVNEALK